MKFLAVTVVALLIALGAAQTPKPTTAKPTTAAPTTKPTTAAPTTKPTTKPTTAAPTTKPTTAAPTTKPTTAAPTTKPTTAAPTTKPTTAAPTTKPTTAAPTTKPTPAAPTTMPPNFYAVTDDSGNNCLIAQFNAVFSGQYELKNGTKENFMFNMPENAVVDNSTSHCGNTTKSAIMVLTFDKSDSLLLEFTMDAKAKTFQLMTANISLTHDETHFPNSNNTGQVNYGGALARPAFSTKLGSYYKCAAEETLDFKSEDFALIFTDLKLQPFDVDKTFGNLSQCAADTPNITPSEPPVGNWTIYNKKDVCMRMQFGADFIINYTMTNGTKSQAGFNMPNATDAVDITKSTCDNSTATLVASFSPDKLDPAKSWVLTMNYTMDKESNYALTNFSLKYVVEPTRFPKVNDTKTVTATNNTKRFSTVSGYYYLCNADQVFDADKVQVKLTKMKVQPFALKVQNKGYGSASDCAADNTISNIVPIAVGCALAGLVIIVLIAYLIGRSRSSRSGYQSV